MAQTRSQIYALLSALLEYPSPGLVKTVRDCVGLLARESPQAAVQIQRFLALTENTPPGRLEEIYTGTFDINPTCNLYVGYRLFGESYKRGQFLVALRERYRERSFFEGNELADHLAVMLRFLGGLHPEETLVRELIEDCLVPALEMMNGSFQAPIGENINPYAFVLRAASSVIEDEMLVRTA